MTKSEMVTWVADREKISLGEAEIAVNSFFDSMTSGLVLGKRIEIRGFGSFSVRDYDGYMGRNPRTGEPVAVPPKRLPFFKLARKMLAEMNEKGN